MPGNILSVFHKLTNSHYLYAHFSDKVLSTCVRGLLMSEKYNHREIRKHLLLSAGA